MLSHVRKTMVTGLAFTVALSLALALARTGSPRRHVYHADRRPR